MSFYNAFIKAKDEGEKYFHALKYFFFSSNCELCGKLLESEENTFICKSCEVETLKDYIEKDLCEICEGPLPCSCKENAFRFKQNKSLVLYNERMRSLIHLLKFKGRKTVANLLAKKLFLKHENFIKKHDIIIAIPLGKKRHKERGYNQSMIAAKEIAKSAGLLLVTNAVKKKKETKALSTLEHAEERKSMMKDAFVFTGNKKDFRGKSILIFDDVMTTGTTLNEAAKTILDNTKAKEINVLTFARA